MEINQNSMTTGCQLEKLQWNPYAIGYGEASQNLNDFNEVMYTYDLLLLHSTHINGWTLLEAMFVILLPNLIHPKMSITIFDKCLE